MLLVALAAVATTRPAVASEPLSPQLSTKFVIDHENPEAVVPSAKVRNQNPLEFGYLVQDLLERSEQAKAAHNYPVLVRYARAIAKGIPESARSWSNLCEAYELVGDKEKALRACKAALENKGVTVQDYVKYVRLALDRPGEVPKEDRAYIDKVLAHLATQTETPLLVDHLRCEIGVKTKDVALLEACTEALAKVAPDDSKTLVFQWTLAVQKGQKEEAAGFLARARKAGLPDVTADRMETAALASGRAGLSKVAVAIAATLAFAGVALMFWRSYRRRAVAA
jgi:tetratricopeptide (TPR) repeat protein